MHNPALTRIPAGAVALTFDDGPSPWTHLALDALARLDARATFFVSPPADASLLRRIAAAGHEIGYHCGTHVRHGRRDRDRVAREAHTDIDRLDRLGLRPRAWRTPWGDLAPWSAGLARELGLELWGWSDDTEDWSGRDAGAMLAGLERSLVAGSVVLMHDGLGPGAQREDCLETIALIAPLVELSRSRGLEPVALSAPTSLVGHR